MYVVHELKDVKQPQNPVEIPDNIFRIIKLLLYLLFSALTIPKIELMNYKMKYLPIILITE